MSQDKDERTKQSDRRSVDTKKTEATSADIKRAALKEEELEEGLEESMPGSDAPASTRRSEKT